MTSDKYRIFLSSEHGGNLKRNESRIREALDNFFSTFVYEEDAGSPNTNIFARPTPRNWLKCDLYILGYLDLGYGRYTIDEFDKRPKGSAIWTAMIYEKET